MGLSTPLLRGEDRASGARGESCCQMRLSQRHHPQSGGGRKVEARARCGAGAHRLQSRTLRTPRPPVHASDLGVHGVSLVCQRVL